ncbi:MAG: MoaD/ThiS family protein [Thermodesulfovibrionales bacterium]
MWVSVKLFATLQINRFQDKTFEVPDGTSVREIVSMIGIDEKDASIIFINGRHQSPETILQDGDILSIFPSIGGG